MGARGPKPGSGGRPRSTTHKPNQRDGYSRETIGPASAGKQAYVHRVKAGVVNAGPNVTVDHVGQEGSKRKNDSGKLQVVSRSVNVSREDKSRGRKRK